MGKGRVIAAATVIVVLLLSVVAGMQTIWVTRANPITFYSPFKISLLSPTSEIAYNSSDIPLSVTVRLFCGGNRSSPMETLNWLNYTIDNNASAPLPYTMSPTILDPETDYLMIGNVTLTGLSDGSHSLIIQGQTTLDGTMTRNITASTIFAVGFFTFTSLTPTPTQNPTLSPAPILAELPYVLVTFIPTPYSTDVPLNTSIAISFGRLPSICDLSITPNVAIKERVKSEVYGGYDTYYFLIDQLEPKTTYTATVTYGQETAPEGYKPTTNRTWQFTTGTSINPPSSPSPIISPSPTQQPTETPPPIPTPSVEFIPTVDYVPALIMWGMLALTIALVAVAYFYFKRKGML